MHDVSPLDLGVISSCGKLQISFKTGLLKLITLEIKCEEITKKGIFS